MKELFDIQQELKAPKGQVNKFGNYKYRSCEDILEAVKPLLKKHKCILVLGDEIVEMNGRFYVKATAAIAKYDDPSIKQSVTAYARETESKKGMDEAQITGACSSYARKYALNGLLCIDDTRDADATNRHGKEKIDFPDFDAIDKNKKIEELVKLAGSLKRTLTKEEQSFIDNAKNKTIEQIQTAINKINAKLSK